MHMNVFILSNHSVLKNGKKYEVKFLMHFVCFFSELLVVEEEEKQNTAVLIIWTGF